MESCNNLISSDSQGKYGDQGIAFVIGFFFSFRLVITILLMRLFGADPQTGSMVRLALGYFLFGVVCFTTLGVTTRRVNTLLQPTSVRWALLFLSFSGCSLLWSETASLPASVAYWGGTAIDVATVFLLFRAGSMSEVATSLMEGFIWSSCSIALIAWLLPTQYDLRLGDEDFFNSNSICNVCAFAVFFAQYLMRNKQARLMLVTLFLSLTILRTLSKTTIAAFLAGEIYIMIQDQFITRRKKVLLTTAAVLIILMFWGLFEAYYDFYTTNGNQAETLTGRTAIWTYVLDAVAERPWIGHGFDSMWNVVPTFGTFEARHAENELLEQLYSYGAAGVLILCGVYGSLYLNIRRQAPEHSRVIWVGMVLFVVVRGFAEAEPFDLLLPLWTIILIGLLVHHQDVTEEETTTVLLSVPSHIINTSQHVPALEP
jgi:exopolysaccharide production protein ExoQ